MASHAPGNAADRRLARPEASVAQEQLRTPCSATCRDPRQWRARRALGAQEQQQPGISQDAGAPGGWRTPTDNRVAGQGTGDDRARRRPPRKRWSAATSRAPPAQHSPSGGQGRATAVTNPADKRLLPVNQAEEPRAVAGSVAGSAEPAVAEPAVGAPELSTHPTRSPAPTRLRWLAVATVLVAVAVIAVVGFTISRGGPGGDATAGGIGLGWRAVEDPDLAFDASWSLLEAVIPGGPGAITTAFGIGDPVILTTADGLDWLPATVAGAPATAASRRSRPVDPDTSPSASAAPGWTPTAPPPGPRSTA